LHAVLFLPVSWLHPYLVMLPMNTLIARARKDPPPDPTTRNCPECLSVIALGARRCPYCTAVVEPAPVSVQA
jgi:large conductance mechanosensitive channel